MGINKSFLYGIGFASATWIVSLYLYAQLSKNLTDKSPNQFVSVNINSLSSKNPISTKKNEFFHRLKSIKKPTSKLDQELFELGIVQNLTEQTIQDEGYKVHAFNVLISNKLSLHRQIPDTRNKLCKYQKYSKDLPKASIVICFYNEHFNTLLRTIQSILDRTPKRYLEEIVLIDDFSDIPQLNQDMKNYIEKYNLKQVKLYKTDKREGLIRARIFGSRKSTGEVLIFLDSHIEVNSDWIQPLLGRIKSNKTNVVMPIIDIINPNTFAYTSSPLVRGGFNWGLHFKWENLPKGTLDKLEDFIKPIISPTMAGGLFAIDRSYFIDIGEYDAGMNIWGGENLEISFRIWMCGGTLEMIPCSRVGHIFRVNRPYGAPDGQDTMLYNSLRMANVWMDDYKEHFISTNKHAKDMDFGDISSRIQLRKELKCHDFSWYLKNIYPELVLPTDDQDRLKKKWAALEQDKFQPWHSRKRNYIDQFYIRLSNTSLCVQSAKDTKSKGSSLVLRPCLKSVHQLWHQTDKNELVLAKLLCLQASKPHPILYKCHELGADQEWKLKGGENSPIYNLGAGTCLAVNHKKVNANLTMKLCTDQHLSTWDIMIG